jgi:hypothetical protein
LLVGLTATAASEPHQRAPEPALVIEDPERHFGNHGFVEMVPPVALPTHADESNRVEVWLKVGTSDAITVEDRDGRPLLHFPDGTDVARVESLRREGDSFRVADVRGTRLLAGGDELFYVYRPDPWRPGRLAGHAWRRGDGAEEALAREQLFRIVSRATPRTDRKAALERFALNNQCARCHAYGRLDNQTPFELGEVNRGTDASGFVLPQTVLRSDAPLESYQAKNPSLDSPFVTARCGEEPAVVRGSPKAASCPNGHVPRAYFDVQRALAAGDNRARRVCESRLYLFSRMVSGARDRFVQAWRECDL